MRRLLLVLWLAPVCLFGAPLEAQRQPAPLAPFAAEVARLWEAGEAERLAGLVGRGGQVVLEVGAARGGGQERHAAAALRALFSERESVGVHPQRFSVSGGDPPRGFVEIAWTSRSRGSRTGSTSTVFIGTVWEDGGWRIRELRLR